MLSNRVRIETLKLLVEIAWADHEIDAAEADYVLGLATQAGVSESERAELERALADEGRLPAPNMHLLREYQEDVLRAVDELIAVDNRIVADERAARGAVSMLLEQA